jgi:hypothetical protein
LVYSAPVKTLVLFALGAIIGSLLDHLHVASGAVSYSRPFLFGAAAWTPLLFGVAAAGFADLHHRLRAMFHGPAIATRPIAIADFLLFVAAYWMSAYLHFTNSGLLAIFMVIYAARATIVREPPHRIAHAFACAMLGLVSEYALTGFGLFVHHRADFLRVPYWLPGLYVLAAPFLADLDELLSKDSLDVSAHRVS